MSRKAEHTRRPYLAEGGQVSGGDAFQQPRQKPLALADGGGKVCLGFREGSVDGGTALGRAQVSRGAGA